MRRTPGLMPLPSSRSALTSERERLERELDATSNRPTRRLLAIERRRVVLRLDELNAS